MIAGNFSGCHFRWNNRRPVETKFFFESEQSRRRWLFYSRNSKRLFRKGRENHIKVFSFNGIEHRFIVRCWGIRPRTRAIDSLAVDGKPFTHVSKSLLHDYRDSSICSGSDIQQQVSAARDFVDQDMNQFCRRSVIIQIFISVIAERRTDPTAFFPWVPDIFIGRFLVVYLIIFGGVNSTMKATGFLTPPIVYNNVVADRRIVIQPREKFRALPGF